MSAKDLKEDEIGLALEHFGADASQFAKTHRNALIGAGLAVVLLAAGVSGWRAWRNSVEKAAQAAFGAAADMAADIDSPPAAEEGKPAPTPKTWTEVAAAFAAVASEHPGTAAGEIAAFQAGVAQLRAGDGAAAATTLDAFVGQHPESWAAPHAWAALAVAREQAGDLAGAEAALVKLKDGDFRSYPPADAMQRLAEFYDRHGRADEAKATWTSLAEDARFADTAAQGAAKAKAEQDKS